MMLAIFGPTVTGKTSLAIDLAKKYNGVLISADSRQVYKNLDIGSGKTQQQLKVEKNKGYWIVNGIKILGFDIKEPGDTFSAWEFANYAKDQIKEIKKENKIPIIVGGTGFYIKCLINELDNKVEPNKALREKLSPLSAQNLYQILLEKNNQKAISLNESDRHNPRRLIRAIEIETSTLSPLSNKASDASIAEEVITIGLFAPNSFLYEKADKWLNTRLEMGMESEIKGLLSSGVDKKWLISLGLEYKWITESILGNCTRELALERLRGDIHAFIRRQKTYFKQFPNIILFNINSSSCNDKIYKTLRDRFAHIEQADIYSNSDTN